MVLRGEDRRALLRWHRKHGRDFPWRKSRDTYRLAVTELMLVRTRAQQVASVWRGFFARFPDLRSLAMADVSTVHEALRGLGLQWRAERIHAFAQHAWRLGPNWPALAPNDLPGLGPYVRAAVTIAVNETSELPVDVTIARVVARYAGIRQRGELRRSRDVRGWVQELGPVRTDFFHALLDLAATICTPRQPACHICPVLGGCVEGSRRISEANTSSSSP